MSDTWLSPTLRAHCLDVASTRALGAVVASVLVAGDIVILSGELGAGKTTFVQGVVSALGGETAVTSPTFVLCHLYETHPPVAHVDCWRLADPREVIDLALEEVLDDGGIALIEWGDLAKDVLGGAQLHVEFAIDDAAPTATPHAANGAPELARTVVLQAQGANWAERLGALEAALVAHGSRQGDKAHP